MRRWKHRGSSVPSPACGGAREGVSPQLDGLTIPGYAALYAHSLNFALCLVLSPIFNRMAATMGTDETAPTDYRIGLRSGG